MGLLEEHQTNECVENLQVVIDRLRGKDKQIEQLQEENNRLKDEHYKDEELKKLRERIDHLEGDCARGFPITEKNKKKLTKSGWNIRKHVLFANSILCLSVVELLILVH